MSYRLKQSEITLPCQYQERQAKGVRIRKSAEERKNICVRTTFVAQLSIKAKARFEPEIVNFVLDQHEDFQHQQLL